METYLVSTEKNACCSGEKKPSDLRRLAEVDPQVTDFIRFEDERQRQKLIMIASESICHPAVREALSCNFTNIYAEGYPSRRMMREENTLLGDHDRHLAFYRRYSDRRYYKGCEYVNFIEALAARRVAECFATPEFPADRIFANVQPLSGAAANNAVYEALVRPGDTVLSMSLTGGGHLTHGSPVNRSGKHYRIFHYQPDRATGRLDYDEIRKAAREHKPRMIIAGYSAFPWDIDWKAFREICRGAGPHCILMADISHPAGLIAAGLLRSPVGVADVITFTTHKTLCGPRGAVILTTDPKKAAKIDFAVFPGEQGGPHINNIAAKAVCFGLAQQKEFSDLQRGILANTTALAAGLVKRGIKLAYGGTETHLLLVECTALKGPGGDELRGDIASRILDLVGITCNKNTISEDISALNPSAVRLGTTFLTQRGLREPDMDRVADIVARTLKAIKPFAVQTRQGLLVRGKIRQEEMETLRREVAELAGRTRNTPEARKWHYPHGGYENTAPDRTPLYEEHRAAGATFTTRHGWEIADRYPHEPSGTLSAATRLCDLSGWGILEVRGERGRAFLEQVLTARVEHLAPGQAVHGLMLNASGEILDDPWVIVLPPVELDQDRFLVVTHPENREPLLRWLRDLTDGYLDFEPRDLYAKVDGPVVVKDLGRPEVETERLTALLLFGPAAPGLLKKMAPRPVDVTGRTGGTTESAAVRFQAVSCGWSESDPAWFLLCPASEAGKLWKAVRALDASLLPDGSRPAEEARARAGLPDYARPEARETATLLATHWSALVDCTKVYFVGQGVLPAESGKSSAAFVPFAFARDPQAPLQRTPLYEEHLRLTKAHNLVPFAGWLMPVLYDSITAEHKAVREKAGLFDVAHMGVFEIAGSGAARFLDLVTTNYVTRMTPGFSQYNYLLDAAGHLLDDIMVYRRTDDRFMMVVNASNADQDWAWLNAVNDGVASIDRERSERRLGVRVQLRNLKDPSAGADRRIDLALQGPLSRTLLTGLAVNEADRLRLWELRKTELCYATLTGGLPILVCRTGYTGEEWGYEIFVHPDRARELWQLLLSYGVPLGLKPAGLGARDSTRTEAGFPLYGHELGGKYDLIPTQAGYGAFIKRHKPFFVGRQPYLARETRLANKLVRFRVVKKGARVIKPENPVVNYRGEVVGVVTSAAVVGDSGVQYGLALIASNQGKLGGRLGIFASSRDMALPGKNLFSLQPGERMPLPEEAEIMPRHYHPVREKITESKAESK